AEALAAERAEADRLARLQHGEALRDLRSRVVVAVAGLVRIDRAGARPDDGDGRPRKRAHARRDGGESHRKTRGRGRGNRERRVAEAAVGERTEGDGLVGLGDAEALRHLWRRAVRGVA